MMAPAHRVGGATGWLAAAPYLGVTQLTPLLAGLVVAVVTSQGRLSPDMDQYYYWTSKIIPGGHRGITHWWGATVLAETTALVAQLGWGFLAVGVGWASHIAGDAVYGRNGVPVWPRLGGGWRYWGVRFKAGGRGECVVASTPLLVPAWPLVVPVALWAWGLL